MFYLLNKLNLFIHQLVHFLYSDADKAFGTGGFIGAGFTATVFNLNYWYWAKVIVSAILGGLINIMIKKLVDRLSKRREESDYE